MKEYKLVIDLLFEEYNDRFKDFEKHNLNLQLAYQPHLVDVNQVPDRFQMELIELSEDSILKSLFNAKKDLIEVWKNAVEYPPLHQHAWQMLSMITFVECADAVIMLWYNIPLRISILIHDTNQELREISDNRCSLGRPITLKINDVGTKDHIISLWQTASL